MARDEKDLIQDAYTVTNHTDDRALDCDSDADAAIADTLGSVIRDLQEQGILKGTVST